MDTDQIVEDALNQPEAGTEEFDQAVAAAFESDATETQVDAAPPVAEEEVEEEQVAAVDAPLPPVEEAPTEIEIGGIRVPADKAEALAEFWNWSQSVDGQTWLRTFDHLTKSGVDPNSLMGTGVGDASVVTRPPPPPAEEQFTEDDYLDPATKRLHDELATTRNELEQIRQTQQAQQAQQAQAMIATASKRFSEEHGISMTETQQLVDHLDRTANLSGYAVDPTTGVPRDGVSTLYAAMEAALWSNPEFRQRELDRVAAEHKDRQQKDRKLAAVGGTSGSVPQKPQPASPADREDWAVEQISEAMGLAK